MPPKKTLEDSLRDVVTGETEITIDGDDQELSPEIKDRLERIAKSMEKKELQPEARELPINFLETLQTKLGSELFGDSEEEADAWFEARANHYHEVGDVVFLEREAETWQLAARSVAILPTCAATQLRKIAKDKLNLAEVKINLAEVKISKKAPPVETKKKGKKTTTELKRLANDIELSLYMKYKSERMKQLFDTANEAMKIARTTYNEQKMPKEEYKSAYRKYKDTLLRTLSDLVKIDMAEDANRRFIGFKDRYDMD